MKPTFMAFCHDATAEKCPSGVLTDDAAGYGFLPLTQFLLASLKWLSQGIQVMLVSSAPGAHSIPLYQQR